MGDAGGEREQSDADPDSEVVQRAGAVAFESEDVFGGVDDRLDPLADAGDDRCLPGFVLAVGADDRGAQLSGGILELGPGVALVGDDRLAAAQPAASRLIATSRSPRSGDQRVAARGVPSGALSRCRRIP